ncbi:MAG: RIP metalloprotease RseP [Planctomycetes bacterium]|nr:RIP metalloprotease RseP [Planctomycetota bacterium]
MVEALTLPALADLGASLVSFFGTAKSYLLMFAGFSLVIFVHELGHFIAAKLCNVRVDKFAVGFGRELFGFTRGETRYAFNLLPLGGYVKMLGQEDFAVDKSGEWKVKEDPRSFTHKPIGQRMFIVSAGVFMNLVFAAGMFAVVFMIGMPSLPAEVGQLQAGMPAATAGLRVGDRITKVNDEPIADWSDLQAAVALSDPDDRLRITFERPDPATGQVKTETVSLSPEMSPENNILRVGMAPAQTNEVALVINPPGVPSDQQLRVGDRIVAIDGRACTSFYEIEALLANRLGEEAALTVERPTTPPDPEERRGRASSQPVETRRVEIRWRARQYFSPTGTRGEEDSGHLLGLVPRQRVRQVLEGQRGEMAGIETGDIIARWGGQTAPRMDEIVRSRRENAGRPIRVTVERAGQGEQTLALTPKSTGLLGRGVPTDGLILGSQENDKLIVADIITQVTDDLKTPAAALKDVMPRGALITKVNDQPVKTWDELSKVFIKLAGTRVKLTWSYQGLNEQSGEMYIPHTIGTTFPLPGARQIVSIDGVNRREIEVKGKQVSVSADNWRGAMAILRDCIGREVRVVYRDALDDQTRTASLHVTPEMLDTWVLRDVYVIDDMLTWQRSTIIQESNPLKASLIGMRKTYYFINQIYLTMQRMIFERTMSVDQISGPVGILQMGSRVAAMGLPVLMYFLAMISANLAVINFLPLPIMDGGIFVFLLIEKIKGSPLSMKVQVATQLIGLALIIGIFLFVTFQDIQKLAN